MVELIGWEGTEIGGDYYRWLPLSADYDPSNPVTNEIFLISQEIC